ncbi:hypothetical protein TDB9533_02277 [Thalassocella blandensis]|nr:hypothetical protein TDB9533_02277 [Thalassocella blandensis]
MKKIIVNLTISTFLVLLSGASFMVSAAEQCPAIDCDCGSLPTDKWVNVCKQYESHIKQECAANGDTPKSYCSIHGENAMPVALSLSVSQDLSLPVTLAKSHIQQDQLDEEELREKMEEKLNATVWSLKADLASAKKMLSKSEFNMAVQTLKLLDKNLDFAMEQNQALVLAAKQVDGLQGKDLQERSEDIWLSFAKDLNEVAVSLEDFANQMETQLQIAKGAKAVKVAKVFSTMAYRAAGKAFEEVGYAYGQAGEHILAANTWTHSADLSAQLSVLNKSEEDEIAGASFTELQSAARMYRASYHWLMNDSSYDANVLLARSQALVENEEQKKIQLLIDGTEKVSPASSLSVR